MTVVPDAIPGTVTARRKDDHIDINLTHAVQAREVTTGLDGYRFVHSALPEIDLTEVRTDTRFLGHHIRAPILISAMTGGTPRGWQISRRLAIAAQDHGLPMGVGSQRAALEDSSRRAWFQFRDVAPDIVLMANLGAVQLNLGYGVDECRRAVEMLEANALVLHLNPLQEALQPEGDTTFHGLLHRIEQVCRALEVPVVVKEIGCGISGRVARQLADAGVAAIDIGGAGGTSWSSVEHFRATDPVRRRVSDTFREWGIPTATSLRMVKQAVPHLPVIASGGLRSGLDVAKGIALGATLGGIAGPLLRAADAGQDAVDDLVSALVEEVRIAMFCIGAERITSLQRAEMMDGSGVIVPSPMSAGLDAEGQSGRK